MHTVLPFCIFCTVLCFHFLALLSSSFTAHSPHSNHPSISESIEWFIEDTLFAVLWFGSSPTPFPLSYQQAVSLSQCSCVSAVPAYWPDGGGGGAMRQIMRPWKSLAIYKSFNALCYISSLCRNAMYVVWWTFQYAGLKNTRSGSWEVFSRWMSNDLSNDGSSEDPCPVISDSLGRGGGGGVRREQLLIPDLLKEIIWPRHTHNIFVHFFQYSAVKKRCSCRFMRINMNMKYTLLIHVPSCSVTTMVNPLAWTDLSTY